MHLNIFVSQRCFVYCKGCYSFSRMEESNKLVPTDKIISFLQFAYKSGVNKVTICGGDPLTRPDIMFLLEQIKKIGFFISLDTLGSTIIQDVTLNKKETIKKVDVQKLAQWIDVIGIPIDGSTDEIFKRFRQTTNDILKQQLKICEELHKNGAKICINTVVHKGNLEDATNLVNLINKIDYISKWQLFKFAPIGKFGLINKNLFAITDLEFAQFKDVVLKTLINKNIDVQFKDSQIRDNTYLLIDNSGKAWIPSFQEGLEKNRTIIGNINNDSDWPLIVANLSRK